MRQLLVIADVPDIGAAEDAKLAEALGFADGSAAGCRLRVSGDANGGRRIVTLWESREAFETWRDHRLARVLLASGQPVPTFEVLEIDRTYGL